MVVAINKIDKPDATADVVKQGLLQHEIVLEDFGGDVLSTPVSAKTGQVPTAVAINNHPDPDPDPALTLTLTLTLTLSSAFCASGQRASEGGSCRRWA